MQTYIIYIHPESPDSKLPEIVSAIQARTEFLAKAQAMSLLETEFPETAFEYAEPLSCADRPGLNRPKLNVLDAEFMKTHVWNEETHEIEPLEQPEETSVNFDSLPLETKMAVLVRFGTTEITSSQVKDAISLAQDKADSFEGHLIEALSRTKSIPAMHPEILLELIGELGNNFEPGDKWPQMKAFIERWQKDRLAARKDASNVTSLRTPSGATAGGKNGTDRSADLTHNHDSLGLEIAAALLPFEFDIYQIPAAVYRRAKEMVALKEQDWSAWNRAMIATPGILDYSRAAIMHCVRTAPENIHLTAGALQQHINKTLTETDHENPLPEIVAIACGQQIIKPGTDNDETKPDDESEKQTLADAANTAGTVEPHSDEPNGAATGVADVPPVTERTGPFYARNEAGEVKRCNKQKALEPLLAQGYTEITKDEYLQLKNKPAALVTSPAEPTPQPEQNKPVVNDLGNGRFSIEGLILTQNPAPQAAEPAPSNEVEKPENTPVEHSAAEFQSIGAALENDLADKGDNLKIWRSVMRTDPRYTKDLAGAGFEGTSINAEYMVMRATEIFGPVGTGWGYEVIEDRMLPGAPMSESIWENNKFIRNVVLRDADGSLITEQNHSIKIKFWYRTDAGTRGEVEAYGATKYLYKTKTGIMCDGEAQKKSLTDAIKKALSLLGFSADVWLGLYDQAEYKQENALEFDIRNASDKAEDVTRIRKELDDKFKLNTDTMRAAVTPNEVSGVASALTRVMGIHLKAAREKADTEYAKYLEGRLRRLEEVKAECLAKLQENAA